MILKLMSVRLRQIDRDDKLIEEWVYLHFINKSKKSHEIRINLKDAKELRDQLQRLFPEDEE